MKNLNLIKRNTQEIVNPEELKKILNKKSYSAYIGFAPTGKLHIGYLIPLVKIADFIKAGFKFKFLIADLHAFLDDKKAPWEKLDLRSKYYKESITEIFKSIGVNTKKIEFIQGKDFQLSKEYMLDLLHLSGETTLNRSKRSSSEVVRFKDDPKLGGFIYPLMQILDPVYLDVDVCFSGIDQRGIYMLGREILPKYKKRTLTCVFTPLLPGLTGSKMSASDTNSKIDILDSEDIIKKKINKSYCPQGKTENNGVLKFIEHVIFPINKKLKIERPEKFGGTVEYKDYESLEKDYKKNKIHPVDIKNQLSKELNNILEPVRKNMSSKKKFIEQAYS